MEYWQTSHCLNPGRCDKIRVVQQKSSRRDWRRNKSQQDLDTFGWKSGQACRKTLCANAQINGQKKNPNWTQRESNQAFTLFLTMILIRRKSCTMPDDDPDQQSLSDALRSHQSSQPERFKLVATLCKWLVWNWSQKSNSSCSEQDHENMIIASQRSRTAQSKEKTHQDHIANWGQVSMSHCDKVHKPIPVPTAMTILEAKAALDKLHKLLAWDESKVSSEAEVKRAKLEGKTVYFATLMDLCHLKNSELENKVQKWCGRRDTVKDDSWNWAEFEEQGASASHMMVAEVLGVISRLAGCSGQASDAVRACTQVKMKGAPERHHLSEDDCPEIWKQIAASKKTTPSGLNWRSSGSAGAQSLRSPTVLVSKGREHLRKFCWKKGGRKPTGCEWVPRPSPQTAIILVSVCWGHKDGRANSEHAKDVGEIAKESRFGRLSIIRWSGTSLGCTQRVAQVNYRNVMKIRKLFSKRISTSTDVKTEEKTSKDITAWSYDMEGRAQKCVVERYCELADKTLDQHHEVSTLAWTTTEENKKIWKLWESCQRVGPRVYWNSCIWQQLEDQIYFGQFIAWPDQSQSGTDHAIFDWHGSPATFITQLTTNSFVTLEIKQYTANWDYSKTPILQEI